ncbi:MFS transporter [Ornithinimicrobium tianjinense]|uniref:MFS transporter n=1 Tax=Ornithinimicrobium tianjinense TaxID=1195761 RepID=A0A917BEK5_9MICO|nr:MFS transporter [Ornithinimicrobium tianjinense]GGF39198.1 MFS transporter [Ornithinimicrobium tianjinense]
MSAEARRRARVAALVGSTAEWYDYFVFATASALVLAPLFFPGEDRLTATLASFAVLGVGFLARPLGGLVLGSLGDRVGRRRVLLLSLWTMGLATTAIGLLPTAEAVGPLAPVLLVVLRLVQGFGVGGEWAGAALVAVENAPADRRARWGSLPQMGVALGAVLATAVFTAVSALGEEALLAWGWRVPFLVGGAVLAVGVWVRSRLTETIDFADLAARDDLATRPVVEAWRTDRRSLLLAAGMRLAENVWGYVVLVFTVSYVTGLGRLSRDTVLLGVSLSILAGIGCYWLAATLADRVGRKPVYVAGGAFGVLFAWPFFELVGSDRVALVWGALLLGWGVASGFSFAIQPAWFTELFGRRTRSAGLSLAYNLATMISGFTPFVATALLAAGDGEPHLVVLLLVGVGVVSLGCALAAPDPYRDGLAARADSTGRRRPRVRSLSSDLHRPAA